MQEDINDAVIYQEMMIHPALFSHPHPERVAIIDDVNCLMLQEALKHENLTEAWEVSAYPAEKPPMDPRIQYFLTFRFSAYFQTPKSAIFVRVAE